MLAELACDHFQGYLYGRPAPASEIVTYLMHNLHDAVSDETRCQTGNGALAAGQGA